MDSLFYRLVLENVLHRLAYARGWELAYSLSRMAQGLALSACAFFLRHLFITSFRWHNNFSPSQDQRTYQIKFPKLAQGLPLLEYNRCLASRLRSPLV